MYWIDEIYEYRNYCVCMTSWNNFYIVRAVVSSEQNILTVYFKPEKGDRVTLFKLRNQEPFPSNLHLQPFEFTNCNHLRIEVYGGSITISGDVPQAPPMRYENFLPNCPNHEIEVERDFDTEFIDGNKKINKPEKFRKNRNRSNINQNTPIFLEDIKEMHN
jgi:hypothetical protein